MDEEQRKLAEELLAAKKREKSFAKELFFGRFYAKKAFPYALPDQSEGVKKFVEKVRVFAKEKIDPDWIDRHAEIPESVLQGLAELGVLGMNIPEEYGGLGYSQNVYCQVIEVLSRRCGSTALFVNVHQSIGARALLLFGTEEQKKRWVPALAKGKVYAAFSLTEEKAGSDAGAVQTRARFDAEKNIYRLTGRKQWTSNAAVADVITVMARTDDGKITAFLVTPDMPGFKVLEPALDKLGMRGTKTGNLQFEEMEVPKGHVLGEVGGGLRVALTVLDYGRLTFGASCSGLAKELLEMALGHAKTRYQFKRPLASFGLVKKKLAEIASLSYAMEAATFMTAGLIDRQVDDVMLETAILKVFNSEALWKIIYETMQIFGGRSFFTDMPLGRIMRDARLNTIGEGANEVLRAFIAVAGLREPGLKLKELKEGRQFLALFKEMGQHLFKPEVPSSAKGFELENKGLKKRVRRFGIEALKVLVRYREDVLEKELILNRLTNCIIALYTASAVLGRVLREDTTEKEVSAAKYYLHTAYQMFDRSIKAIRRNKDEETEALSDTLTEIGVGPW